MIQYLQPAAVPASAAPFSQVVVDDMYAHFAGLVAADFPEGKAVLGDVGAETRAVLEAIRAMAAELGFGLERVVRVDVHLTDLAEFDAMDAVYRTFFEDGKFPARTTTESPQLFAGSRVEVTCTARLPDLRVTRPLESI